MTTTEGKRGDGSLDAESKQPFMTRRGFLGAVGGLVAMAQVKTPAETLMFVDDTFNGRTAYYPTQGVGNWGANFCNPPGLTAATTPPLQWGVNTPYGRHNDGVNVAFCDGHAKWMQPLVLWNNGSDTPYYKGW